MSDRKPIEAPDRIYLPMLYHRCNAIAKMHNTDTEYIRADKYSELKKCNKLLADVNLNNAWKIAELKKNMRIAIEALEIAQQSHIRQFGYPSQTYGAALNVLKGESE